jgi:Zn-dependent protease with chaperone function
MTAPFVWNPGERESFFAAIERHRRAAWRVSVASAVSALLLALVVAVLLAPLLYCVVGLILDLINLAIPMPNLLGAMGRFVDRATNGDVLSAGEIVRISAIAAIPGLVVMALVLFALRRAMFAAPLFNAGEVSGRLPSMRILAEQRIVNVVDEMTIASGIPRPRVIIAPGGVNAVAVGRDEAHATLLIGEGLLQTLDREQMQGVVGHLIGSIADGDMVIGLRAAVTLALFALMARLTSTIADRDAWHSSWRLIRSLVVPTARSSEHLMAELSDPMQPKTLADRQARIEARQSGKLTWREWAQMPLMGPIVMSGFMAGMVSAFILAPLVAFVWRRRKYMADATAVRLTRDPDALSRALFTMAGASTQLAPWASHLGVVGSARGAGSSLIGASVVDVFPSLNARERALVRMGAQSRPVPPSGLARIPLGFRVVVYGLLALCFALGGVVVVLLVWLSAALSMLFTIMPTGILHLALRALGR